MPDYVRSIHDGDGGVDFPVEWFVLLVGGVVQIELVSPFITDSYCGQCQRPCFGIHLFEMLTVTPAKPCMLHALE